MMPIIIPMTEHNIEDDKVECPKCGNRFFLPDDSNGLLYLLITLFAIGMGVVLFIFIFNFVVDYDHRTFTVYVKDSFNVLCLFLKRLTS